MDRHKYVAELAKLLSGMAAADREAVLRGVNRRFDEGDNDAAVIASLGSPTFAAVSVLRGYVPPEEDEPGEAPGAAEPGPAVVEPTPIEPEAEPEPEPGPEPEPEPEEPEEPEAEPEPEQEPEPEAEQEPEIEPEPEAEPEAEPEPELEEAPEPPAEPEPEAEAEGAEAEEPVEAQEEQAVEAEEPAEASEAAGTDGPVEPAEPDEPSELPPFWGGPPELPRPPKAKVGLLIVYVFFGAVIGIPVTAVLTAFALAILCAGAAVIAAAAVLVSFCFLGMSVVADILLLAGAGLVLAALGLLLVCLAVGLFRRCAVGFVDLVIRKGRDWCYEHGKEESA